MKILLLGDAGNYHATLASALRRLGHNVTVASDGSGWMDTRRDIDLSRHKSKIGGAFLWARLCSVLAPDLKGYDVVQLCSPFFVSLRPERLLSLFSRLKRDNGRVFLTDLGNTPEYVRMCLDPDSPLRYSEWSNPSIPSPRSNPDALAWFDPDLTDYCSELYSGVDGVMTALYEYHLADRTHVPESKLHYLGIPVDLDSLPEHTPHEGPVRILSAYDRSRASHKGADILRDMAAEAVKAHPGRAELVEVCNLPYRLFLDELSKADIVLDQLYSYTPATTALLSMASGAVPVSGGEEDYYSFIGEHSLRPIVNANPFDPGTAARELGELISSPALLDEKRRQGREFVELYHSADALALRCLDIWTSY